MGDIEPQRRLTSKVIVGLLAALVVALAPAACGDDDADTETEGGSEPSAAAQEREVERALEDYGQARGADTCEFVTQEYIDSEGGLSKCARAFEDSTPTKYKIESINVSGTKGSARGKNASTGEDFSLDLLLEDGEWKVDPR